MDTRNKRTARRFQVEALETRCTPGGAPGGVVMVGAVCHVGEEIPQVQVHVVPLGGAAGGIGGEFRQAHVAPVPFGSKPGIASGSNAFAVPSGAKPGVMPLPLGGVPGGVVGNNAVHVTPLGGKGSGVPWEYPH